MTRPLTSPRIQSYPFHTIFHLFHSQNPSNPTLPSLTSFSHSLSKILSLSALMATTLPGFGPAGIRASATSGNRKSDQNRGKPASSNWLTPLFGWSADPDYIDNTNSLSAEKRPEITDVESETARSRSRFALGCFTEDKAKQLRRKTMESATFHDIMYHSAIASRLATDVSDRYGD